MILPASQGLYFVKFSTASFRNLLKIIWLNRSYPQVKPADPLFNFLETVPWPHCHSMNLFLQQSQSGSKSSLNSGQLDFGLDSPGLMPRSQSSSQIHDKDPFLDSGVHETRSLQDHEGAIRSSPERLNNLTLTEAQQKSLTGTTICTTLSLSLSPSSSLSPLVNNLTLTEAQQKSLTGTTICILYNWYFLRTFNFCYFHATHGPW